MNTHALPSGSMSCIRSDFPGNLSDDEVKWLLNNGITTIVDLREKGFDYYHLPVTGGGDTPKSPEMVFVTYLGMFESIQKRSRNTYEHLFCKAWGN